MVSINRVTIIGNLGRDPERQQTPGGTPYAKFSVATNENYQDRNGTWQKSTEWHSVKVWGHSVDRVMQQLKRGSLVYIEGTLRSYELDSPGGQMGSGGARTRFWEIKAQTWRSLDPRDPNNAGAGMSGYPQHEAGGFAPNPSGSYNSGNNYGSGQSFSGNSYTQQQPAPAQNSWGQPNRSSQGNSWGAAGGSQAAPSSGGNWGAPPSGNMGGSPASSPQSQPLSSPQEGGGSGGSGEGDDPIPF
jgi:single-strand DNA-binding protein